MTRIPRNQATGLEVLATFIGLGVYILIIWLTVPLFVRIPGPAIGIVATYVDFSLTFLLMTFLMPTWAVVGLEKFRLRHQAEACAQWWAVRHPLMEQRIECALRAAYLAIERGDQAAALQYAEMGLAIAGTGLDRPVISFYYALCLSVRASFLVSEGRYQEALEDYASATRLHLKPPTLTAQYYAHAAGLLYFLGRFDESLLYARQAIAAAPQIESYHLSLAYRSAALSLAELGQYKEAEQLCEVGMRIKPHTAVNVLMIADRAWLLGMSGAEVEADTLFKELEPQATTGLLSPILQQEYHEVLGRLRLSQGKWKEAEMLFRNSLTEAPGKHLSALYHLTLISQNRGESKAAQEYRERLLRESPECFYAQRLQNQIPMFE